MSGARAAHTLWKKCLISRWNVTNFQVTEKPYWSSKLTIPGLMHEHLDQNGNTKVTSIMHICNLARFYALNKPYDEFGNIFLDWTRLTKESLTFASAVECKLSEKLFYRDVPKWPLDVEFTLGCVGSTSIATVTRLFLSGETTDPLITHVTQTVLVDKATRKPKTLPEWFGDKYKGKGCLEKGLIVLPLKRPSGTFSYEIPIMWSDTDRYKHTHFSSYARIAEDAAHAAVFREERLQEKKTGQTKESSCTTGLCGLSKDIIANGLKTLQICYLAESSEGQTLNVHVWQEDKRHLVFCSIERDEQVICQVKLEYFQYCCHDKSTIEPS